MGSLAVAEEFSLTRRLDGPLFTGEGPSCFKVLSKSDRLGIGWTMRRSFVEKVTSDLTTLTSTGTIGHPFLEVVSPRETFPRLADLFTELLSLGVLAPAGVLGPSDASPLRCGTGGLRKGFRTSVWQMPASESLSKGSMNRFLVCAGVLTDLTNSSTPDLDFE